MISGTTRTHVSQLAFDNRIQLTELTDTVKSLEDTLIDMTEASAEFAAA
jgi:ABC-2 type transport system ATP-binding protein